MSSRRRDSDEAVREEDVDVTTGCGDVLGELFERARRLVELEHRYPQTDCAAWRSQRTPSSRSSTGTRSSAEWMSRAAVSESIARAGKKPYATVSNACRNQCESVKPATQMGAATAPGSSASTNDCTASQSGPPICERVPP